MAPKKEVVKVVRPPIKGRRDSLSSDVEGSPEQTLSVGSPAKKNLIERPQTPPALKDLPNEGIFIVESGKCSIVHRYDNFKAKDIRRWDFFGECELLKVIVITLFANVVGLHIFWRHRGRER